MIVKNIHEKLMTSISSMIINFPFYGEFNGYVNFYQDESIGTCAVNVTSKGMNFYYSTEFLDKLSQKEVNFVTLHENFHLLFDHPKRTINGQYDPKLSNVAQDMIINHIIVQEISDKFVDIPKDENGKNMALFVPKEYEGELIFEELYFWLKKEKEEWGKNKENNSEMPEYGPFSKDPKTKGQTIDSFSKEKIFEDLDKNDGQYLDAHIKDEVNSDIKQTIIDETINTLKIRGLVSNDIERTIDKLVKKKKDYLKEIKRSIKNTILGDKKTKTISRPNRKGISGLKGYKKTKNKINCILDTSGSMIGRFEKVLSYIYRNDVEINLIQTDTEVKSINKINKEKDLKNLIINGLGGTTLTPAIKLVEEKYNNYNTVILTDGFCESIDFSKLKGRVLVISTNIKINVKASNNKIKQIIIEDN